MDEKFSPEQGMKFIFDRVNKSILKKVYDSDDNVLFGSRMTKGKVAYHYIPAEYMSTGRPFLVNTSIYYDGVGNANLSKDETIIAYQDLPTMFPDNIYE